MTTETAGSPTPRSPKPIRSASPEGIEDAAPARLDEDPAQRLAALVLEHGVDVELAFAPALGHQLEPESGGRRGGLLGELLGDVGALDRDRGRAGDGTVDHDDDFGRGDLLAERPADDLELPVRVVANPEVAPHPLAGISGDVDDLEAIGSHPRIVRKKSQAGPRARFAGLDAHALPRPVVERDDAAEG